MILVKTTKLDALKILGFGMKGNVLVGKEKDDVIIVDKEFAARHEPKVGDFMVRPAGSDDPWQYMSAADAAEFKESKK